MLVSQAGWQRGALRKPTRIGETCGPAEVAKARPKLQLSCLQLERAEIQATTASSAVELRLFLLALRATRDSNLPLRQFDALTCGQDLASSHAVSLRTPQVTYRDAASLGHPAMHSRAELGVARLGNMQCGADRREIWRVWRVSQTHLSHLTL
ncbi:hypothetical protein L1887_62026 [Cichorium endivia]|nr:hypothetical protein L1887_62026 [Cichorium endivia]